MNLSPNFTLAELTKSHVALRHGIDNTPDDAAIANLKSVAEKILQPVRNEFKIPFAPSSGYRSPALNERIGSKNTSQHVTGQAVDFEVPGISNFKLAEWIRDNLDFDQVILECYTKGEPNSGWVHCSYVGASNRQVALTYADRVYGEGLFA